MKKKLKNTNNVLKLRLLKVGERKFRSVKEQKSNLRAKGGRPYQGEFFPSF